MKKIVKAFIAICISALVIGIVSGCIENNVVMAAERKIDVWDFGGVQEKDTSVYNNHIVQMIGITMKVWEVTAFLLRMIK